ncbi:hypothetical protein JTE90_028249 [Oedothorax gibbosus]|uniref:Uncharacterized protein n=1 Tax=Oedothorax gibbosus TaxID=931172 RepID=A0AAV6UTJ3_9ARAC|nr:hypothetical protein JTE90_028249 [Oedothorax gibbosus]
MLTLTARHQQVNTVQFLNVTDLIIREQSHPRTTENPCIPVPQTYQADWYINYRRPPRNPPQNFRYGNSFSETFVTPPPGIRQRPGNNNESNSSSPPTRMKESQSIWQKATSLRQSLRHSSRVKLGQKSGFEFNSLSPGEKCATLGPSSSKSQQQLAHKEWGSQRNLARERRSLAALKPLPSEDMAASKRSLHSRSLCMSGDWDIEDANNQKQTRSPRKLTKDSGYETSAQCDPDYANSLSDWLSEEKVIGETAMPARAILPDKKDPRDLRGMKGKDER